MKSVLSQFYDGKDKYYCQHCNQPFDSIVAAISHENNCPKSLPSLPQPEYEYKVQYFPQLKQEEYLEVLASKGWELISVDQGHGFLKRRKR